MHVVPLKVRGTFVAAIISAVALAGFVNNVNSQGTGAVWVDTSGTVVGPALGNQQILLKIPSVGQIVLGVDMAVLPTTFGDPIRWKYRFANSYVPGPNPVMKFESSNCSGQGYMGASTFPFGITIIGNTVLVAQYSNSVINWLVVGQYPIVVPTPHFNSQLVHDLPGQGFGAFCQTVDISQGGTFVRVTHKIDQQTLASPPLILQ